jgi:hypothetical protein
LFVPVTAIRVSEKKLRKLSNAKIRQYWRRYEAGDNFPPIKVEDNGGFYTIQDGRHRFQAQLLAGWTHVEVNVR